MGELPRKIRLWFPGAIYHIMSRGNHKHDIFLDEEDRHRYMASLLEARKEYDFNLFAYCLMTNHVHLQIQTNQTDISTIMKRINMNYAQYFNRKYDTVGHLFQGRYRSELIDTDPYNLQVSRYIHLNPVKAEMVKSPEEYPWSSYRNYLGQKQESFISTDRILGYFLKRDPFLYQKYVESGITNE